MKTWCQIKLFLCNKYFVLLFLYIISLYSLSFFLVYVIGPAEFKFGSNNGMDYGIDLGFYILLLISTPSILFFLILFTRATTIAQKSIYYSFLAYVISLFLSVYFVEYICNVLILAKNINKYLPLIAWQVLPITITITITIIAFKPTGII